MTSPTQHKGSQDEADVIDLEEHAKAKKPIPPHEQGRRYRIRIDKEHRTVDVPNLTGAQILALVGKTPTGYRLDQKLHGGQTKKIEPSESVDFTKPGVEKFMTLPLDQTEGALVREGR